MAFQTYWLSFVILVNLVFRKADAKKMWALFCLLLYAYLGPWSITSIGILGYFRYWFAFWCLTVMSITAWFYTFEPSPDFVKTVQDLDFACYYKSCELVGDLEDIRKEGTLFAFHPHGAFCIGYGWNACWSKRFRELAGLDTKFMISKVLRSDNPFFKIICDLHGGFDVLDKTSLQECMQKNLNVAFVPGGSEEATASSFQKEQSTIRQRTGFIKYALQYGYKVTPVYTFGESESYYTLPWFMSFRRWLTKEFGIPAGAIFGLPLLPLMPRTTVNIRTVVGKPIEFEKNEEPTGEDVKRAHAVYTQALEELFEEHKKDAGIDAETTLEII
eukprot:CAMPEP_0169246194 /NCGR_PEP_ID=MMETSP1016-20121227/34602_1 /TAXON_ID=342587 /ORGANISM="Karlodinium micrum, Strain CCMP2283" /LENGTH=329 /DNA_ID=CAMNT_0009326753 /DNA_START=83 /DNA_END=1072 /DNA_ORIENTATION=+